RTATEASASTPPRTVADSVSDAADPHPTIRGGTRREPTPTAPRHRGPPDEPPAGVSPHPPADRGRPGHGVHPSDADPGGGDPGDPGRSRSDRLRVHRHRQDGGVPAADPAAPSRGDGARHDARPRPLADAPVGPPDRR